MCFVTDMIYLIYLLLQYLNIVIINTKSQNWPWQTLAILLRPFGFLAPEASYIIWFSSRLTLRIPNEGYSRNESFTLNYTSTFLLLRRQTEFEVKDTTNTQKSPSYLDLHLEIDSG